MDFYKFDTLLQGFLNNSTFGEYRTHGRSNATHNSKCEWKTTGILFETRNVRWIPQRNIKVIYD